MDIPAIPDDIRETARAIAGKLGEDHYGDFGYGYSPTEPDTDIIARAILAERARCAKICEDIASGYDDQQQDGWQQQRADELRYVAIVIRKDAS